jgi:hypothetical protein
MSPLMFTVLACAFECVISIFLIRFLVRRTAYGYVSGSLIMTVVPALLCLRILSAVAIAYFAKEIARQIMLGLFAAFGAGSLIGFVLGKISNKRETL